MINIKMPVGIPIQFEGNILESSGYSKDKKPFGFLPYVSRKIINFIETLPLIVKMVKFFRLQKKKINTANYISTDRNNKT
jgi:hypothetical protein